jgi:glycosyltransferase involved in cell wall biosynthesis
MKIVHVEDFIHPNAGYQINMLGRLQAQQGHQVDIVAGEMDKFPDILKEFFGTTDIPEHDERFRRETGARIHRIPLHGFYSGRAIFHPFKLFRQVRRLDPDVVFVHSEDTLTGILFILFSRWLSYPLVLDCHMLEMASVNPYRAYFRKFYRTFVTPIILKRKIPLIRVADSDYVEKCFGIPLSHTHYLPLGTDTELFQPNSEMRQKVREQLGLSPDAFVVLYAGKLDPDKGGKFFSEALLKKLRCATGRPLEFVIIGNAVGEYGRTVEENFAASENRIIRLPTQRYPDLANFFQAADVAAFPRQCSMSFFQVQACGLPVLFEENEINNIRVSSSNAFTFRPGSIDSFRERLLWLASQSASAHAACSRAAREYALAGYDFVAIAKQYTEVLRIEAEKWKSRNE